jgi:hypothetical protein
MARPTRSKDRLVLKVSDVCVVFVWCRRQSHAVGLSIEQKIGPMLRNGRKAQDGKRVGESLVQTSQDASFLEKQERSARERKGPSGMALDDSEGAEQNPK